ncbi:MAG: PKD domain-containing protein [Opitutaceae bacterium]
MGANAAPLITGNAGFKGKLCEFAVWAGVALTAQQAADLYAAGGVATAAGQTPSLYTRLGNTVEDETGVHTPTVTGTTVVDGPVTSPPANQPPEGAINAPSSDVTITVGQSVNFAGSGSDPDGNTPLSCLWDFGAGSGVPDSTAKDPGSVTFNNGGLFTVTFTVADALGLADPTPATRAITVEAPPPSNQEPVADAGPDQQITLPVEMVNLDGAISDDGLPGGSTLTNAWSKQSGPGTVSFGDASAVDTTATFGLAGTYVLRLTADDGELQAHDELTVVVNASSTPQALSFDGVDDSVPWGDIEAFDGLSKLTVSLWLYMPSSAPDWSGVISDIGEASGPGDTHGWVIERNGNSAELMIGMRNDSGIAGFLGWEMDEWHHLVITYDGTAASGWNNRVKRYIDGIPVLWVSYFGSVPGSLGLNDQPLRFGKGGPYGACSLAEVVVWAGAVLSASEVADLYAAGGVPTTLVTQPSLYAHIADDTIIDAIGLRTPTIEGAPTFVAHPYSNQAPIVDAGPDQQITLPLDTINLDGAISDDGLPAGSALTSNWSKQSGPGTVSFADASAADTAATFGAVGAYVLRLSADDGELSSFDEMTVLLLDAAPSVPTGLNASQLTATGFTLNWETSTDDVGVTGYEVFQDGVSIGTSATTSFDVTGLSPDTAYEMTARASDGDGNWSAESVALNVTTGPDTQAPSVPSGLIADEVMPTGFSLSWNVSSDDAAVTGYEVFQDGISIGTTATTTFNVTGLSPDITHAMTVSAHDAADNASAQSAPLEVTTPPPNSVTITLDVPVNESAFLRTSASAVAASVTAVGLTVQRVEFDLDGVEVQEDASAPYAITLSNVALGEHVLLARAIDNLGNATESQPVTVFVVADLPYLADFEPAEGYLPGPLHGQLGWMTLGQVEINEEQASSGSRSITLVSGPVRPQADQDIVSLSGQSVVFIDVAAKPVAATDLAQASQMGTGAALISALAEGGEAEIHLWDGAGDGTGTWKPTGARFTLDAGNRAVDWLDLTIRQDFNAKKWDVYVDGRLALYDLGFADDEDDHLSRVTFLGPISGAGHFDALYAGTENPLFADADLDGMDDAWETQHGLSISADDRAGDSDQDGLTNINEYMLRTSPASADTDGDSLPDSWEASYGLDPVTPAGPTEDTDGDGLHRALSRSAPTRRLPVHSLWSLLEAPHLRKQHEAFPNSQVKPSSFWTSLPSRLRTSTRQLRAASMPVRLRLPLSITEMKEKSSSGKATGRAEARGRAPGFDFLSMATNRQRTGFDSGCASTTQRNVGMSILTVKWSRPICCSRTTQSQV